jgi:hypothetical protein
MLGETIHIETAILTAPVLRRLYEDWKIRRHCRIPRRADFDPAALSYILGKLSLVEVWREPLRFRARVHGTSLVQRLGIELTGKFFDEAPDLPYLRLTTAHFAAVVAQERPSFSWVTNDAIYPPAWECETLVLPLSREGNSVDFLLAGVVHRRSTPLAELTQLRHRIVPLLD